MTCRSASHYPFLDMLRLPFEDDTNEMYGDWDTPEQNSAARERAQDTIRKIEGDEP